MKYRILVTTIFSIVASSRADLTAASFTTSVPITVASTGSNVYGWEFSTSSDIQVTSLGIYAIFGERLSGQHPIGIWDVSNPSQLVVSAIIPAGTVAPIVQSSFRYIDISPVTLDAGHDYVIAALWHDDDPLVDSLNASNWQLTMGPDLKFDGVRYGANYPTTTLSFPSGFNPSYQEFGPNFTYNIVPEPSMSSLCVLALTVLFFSGTIMPFRSRTGP